MCMTQPEQPVDDGDDAIASVMLMESDEPADDPPDDWDAEAHADEYADDPDVEVRDDDGDDGEAVG